MTANATHTGRITIPGTDIGVAGTLVAEPQTENMLLSLDDRLALGPVKVDTDPNGNLYAPGLVVPIIGGPPPVLWLLRFEPFDSTRAAPFVLGVFNLNTSLVPLEDLVATDVLAIDETTRSQIAAAAALGATNNTATASFVTGAGATQTALDARYSRKGGETILYAGDNGVVGDGTTPDWSAMVALLSTAGGMVGTHGAVVVDIKDLVVPISNTLTVPSGVTLRASSGGKFLLTQSRARMFDQTSTTGATFDGVTFDSRGLVTVQVVLVPATGVDTRFINKCKWTNTAAVSVAVTNKALASNVVTLTVGSGHGFNTGDTIYVHGVNGLTAADAGAFNTGSGSLAGGAAQSATISATTSTTISYPYYGSNTHADVTTSASSGGYVTKGISGAGVYSISCENAVRPYIEDAVFDGVRGGIRLYQACVSPRIIRPRFREWGDRCIFGVSTAGLLSTDVKILGAIIEAPSQKFGDPHQPIAFQGVATGEYHDGVEVAGCVSFGATSGGNLVPHHGRTTTDLFGGTADAFSFHHCRNLDVHDNVSKNSGEVGYTISNDCTQFMVHHNVSDGANSVGYAFDWGGAGTSFIGKASAFHDNISLNAGQERGQAAVGLSPRTGASSAFWLSGVTDMLVHDNIARDTQGTPTQTSAYYIKDVTTGLSIGKTKLEGGTTLLLNASSSYTGTVDFYLSGTAGAPQVDTFTASGTWTKPTGAVRCDVIVISGGAGGGSGRRGAAASIRAGGGGGAGGVRVFGQFLAADLGSTETVTVGTGGAGGTAVTVDSTNGVDGGVGNLSGFGASGVGRWLTAHFPNGGTGGQAGATTGGGAAMPGGSIGASASATGAAGTTANNATGKGSTLTAGAGGSGGGITTADAQSAGGAGGTGPTGTTTAPAGGAAGGSPGTVGTTTKTGSRLPGTGGGGGGSNLTGAGGAGGAGSAPGGGGGGGGASVNGNNSGAGGAGADGAVYVVTYFS